MAWVMPSMAAECRVKHSPCHPRRSAPIAELGICGSTQLAHGQDVERRAERARDLEGDRHAAARKRHDHRLLAGQSRQLDSQPASGVSPIKEHHGSIVSLRGIGGIRGHPQSRAGFAASGPARLE